MNSKNLKESLIKAMHEYVETLKFFNINRGFGLKDENQIVRAMEEYGEEFVILALRGARREQASDGFDPARFFSLRRVFDYKNIERFANLGAMSAPKMKVTRVEDLP